MPKNSKDIAVTEAIAGLTRVMKKVRRRGSDGQVRDVEQAYHVRQAAPGDRYASVQKQSTQSSAQQVMGRPIEQEAASAEETPTLGGRVQVAVHDIPWAYGVESEQEVDPIPSEVRQRFSPGNREARSISPGMQMVPLNTVSAGNGVQWGSEEKALLEKLRSGTIVSVRSAGSDNGILMVKLEIADGSRYNAYMRMEGLNDPFIYQVWDNLYSLKRGNGDLSKRAAAAYEVSKAAGLDDLIPPTVVRADEYGDLDPILSKELIERRVLYSESLARASGENPDKLKKHLGGYASVQLYVDESHTIEGEKWFADIFASDHKTSKQPDILNRFFEAPPPGIRVAMIRCAVLDFILWTADRHLGNMTFCDDPSHPMHVTDNHACLPDPRAMAKAFEQSGGSIMAPTPVESEYFPMLWSDPVLYVVLRGGEHELYDYDKIGYDSAKRIGRDRAIELSRALFDHGLPPLHVAGMLARVRMLRTAAQQIAKDPYIAARYLSQLIASGAQDVAGDGQGMPQTSELIDQFSDVPDYVNEIMSKATGREYDFIAELSNADDDISDQ